MQIRITIPDEFISLASHAGMDTEHYVEQILERLVEQPSGSELNLQKLRAELLADWDHYQTTGLHLDGDEVDQWLDRLEKGESCEPPALHN